jgi:Flp pilus assembly pilin Flp
MKTKADQNIFRRLLKEEVGITIVEELVSIAIIGMGIVILVTMITTGVIGVQQVDDTVRSDSLARSQLELIKDAPYQADPISSPYPAVGGLPGYLVAVNIEYWNASTGSFQSGLRNDGLQRITVVVSTGGSPIKNISGFKVDR